MKKLKKNIFKNLRYPLYKQVILWKKFGKI